ncbi:MAG: DUF3575 domain-containing protein [Pseudarcicella sp.]|nr:DUF3575 domain-containing protein [Pseudarcicella sp.]MBP6411702.1 DUF3575 domain-containing protein [Pseudarcicella sp.]
MKKNLLYFFLIIPSFVSAQLDIKLNTSALLSKKPEIGLEMGYNKFSVELVNGFIFQKWGEATVIDSDGNETEIGVKRYGYNGTLRANYYFSPTETLDGWFVSPLVKYRSQKIQFENPIKNQRLGAGFTLGRKGLITEKIGYLAEGGFGYWFVNKYKDSNGMDAPVYRDVPFIGDLLQKMDKYMVPWSVTVFYRIGE